MALKMTSREVDGVSVIGLAGRVVLGEESNALREAVKGLLAGSCLSSGRRQHAWAWTHTR